MSQPIITVSVSVALIALSSSVLRAEGPKTDKQTDDISEQVFTPLDDAAQSASNSPRRGDSDTPKGQSTPPPSAIATPAGVEKPLLVTKPTTAVQQPTAPTENAPIESVQTAPTLPELPFEIVGKVYQLRGVDVTFARTPLLDALSFLCRQTNKPIHTSLNGEYFVTGSWKNATAPDILQDIVTSCGLNLRDNKFSYTVDDQGIPIALGEALVVPAAGVSPIPNEVVKANTLSEQIMVVPKKEGKALTKAISAAEKARTKLMKEREDLSR